jgi:hypothetical protein
VIIAILAGVAGWLAGARYDVLARVNSFPRLPLSEGTLTTGGIIVAIGVVAVSLIGALLGGLAGMRYHQPGRSGRLARLRSTTESVVIEGAAESPRFHRKL